MVDSCFCSTVSFPLRDHFYSLVGSNIEQEIWRLMEQLDDMVLYVLRLEMIVNNLYYPCKSTYELQLVIAGIISYTYDLSLIHI